MYRLLSKLILACFSRWSSNKHSSLKNSIPLTILSQQGLEFTGSAEAIAIMQQIMQLAQPLNATQVVAGGSNVDSGPWGQAGVPVGAPMIANQVMR
jgi:hypothetical protein